MLRLVATVGVAVVIAGALYFVSPVSTDQFESTRRLVEADEYLRSVFGPPLRAKQRRTRFSRDTRQVKQVILLFEIRGARSEGVVEAEFSVESPESVTLRPR